MSSRARHVRLVVTAGGELTVVIPHRFDQRRIPAIVRTKLPWIERARARMARGASTELQREQGALPERLVLPAVGEEWEVEYRLPLNQGRNRTSIRAISAEMRSSSGQAAGGRLIVSTDVGDEAARDALLGWLRRRAERELSARLAMLADLHGLDFAKVGIRHQRTRWGSCSRRGVISLNLCLLFLEPALLDHVLLHELCHTRELNHSPRFWALLSTLDPKCAANRRQTRDAWRSLPGWLHPGPGSPSAIP